MRRLIPLALLIALLVPGHWLRNITPPVEIGESSIRAITFEQGATVASQPTLERAWHISGPRGLVGGYSALLSGPSGLWALSDNGAVAYIKRQGTALDAIEAMPLAGQDRTGAKRNRDIEAATNNSGTGESWLAFEGSNTIARYSAHWQAAGVVAPAAMAGWRNNSGAEAMVRLKDGRFVVLAEGKARWFGSTSRALLFRSDPLVETAEPIKFLFRPPTGYSPTDMAALPGGKVLILLRRFRPGFPPRFSTKMVLADPADIREGGVWAGRELTLNIPEGLHENYEGLAIDAVPHADGGVTFWLISDDNFAAYQRSLLLQYTWQADKV